MPNIVGPDLPAILGGPQCPPPGVGFVRRLKRGVKKAGRGIARGAKKAGKVAVKIHTKPIKLVAKAGKFALLKAAQAAATPVRLMFKKLALRRARLLSWQRRKSMQPNAAEKSIAVTWAVDKMNRKGPLGKFGVRILKFTKGATLGKAALTIAQGKNPHAREIIIALRLWHTLEHALKNKGKSNGAVKAATKGFPVSVLGLTGVEIAAAAASIAGAIAAIMKSLNKPGEAPEDPRASEPAPEAAEAEEAIEEASTEGWF